MARDRVAVLGLGGTISSEGAGSLDVLDYPEHGRKLPAGEIVAGVPELAQIADIEVAALRDVSSSAISVGDWFSLREQIIAACSRGAEAVVVLHGTGSLEETAYFLHLTLPVDNPVVLVGSQRPFTTVSSDAAMNIVAGVRGALAARGRDTGVLVVLNDEIHSAREARKLANYRLNTFESPGVGPLGFVDGDQVTWNRVGTKRHTTSSMLSRFDYGDELCRVDVIYSYVGADGAFVRAAEEAGAKGLVSAGFAPGMPTPEQRAALLAARERGVVVVQSSRAVRDRVPPRRALFERGFIAGGDLSPQKCRILLMLALSATVGESDAINDLFATH
jgi:L-asparaginase